jgi:hypothetical protein
MSPERKTTINGYLIEEYDWAGSFPVYVNHKLYNGTYKEAVEQYSKTEEV